VRHRDIEPKDIRSYQDDRLEEEASPKTINSEIGTLRSILRRSGVWTRIKSEVSMLQPGEEIEAIAPRWSVPCWKPAASPDPVHCCRS
jgi:hypothetical protein